MKAKVVKPFIDKESPNKTCKKNDDIEITKERFKEVNSTRYGELVKEVKTKKKK